MGIIPDTAWDVDSGRPKTGLLQRRTEYSYKRMMYCYESPAPRFAQRGYPSEIAPPIECVGMSDYFLRAKGRIEGNSRPTEINLLGELAGFLRALFAIYSAGGVPSAGKTFILTDEGKLFDR
jgi:hypothetical protein